MKKLSLLLFIPLILSVSCSSSDDSDSNSSGNFISITRNGETFNENNLAYGISVFDNCNDSSVLLDYTSAIVYIENSEFSFSLGIAHPSDKSVFENVSASVSQVNIEASDNGLLYIDCLNDFDLIIEYSDKSSNVSLDDSANNTNTIESINLINETSTKATYGIKGNYVATYTDGSGYNITINGSYLLHVDTLK